MNITIKRLYKHIPLPEYEPNASCFDITCREDTIIKPKEITLVPTGLVIKVPPGYTLFLFARSSTPLKKGLLLANSVGIIDPFFCGDKDEILQEFYNITDHPVEIKAGERLTQGMFVKNEIAQWQEVATMNDSGRGGYDTSWHKKSD